MFSCDYLIVDSGLAGTVIARVLNDAGKPPFVLDQAFVRTGLLALAIASGEAS